MSLKQQTADREAKKYEELDFTDNFLFSKILEKRPEIAQKILELILKKKIRKVVINKEKTADITARGKGIRLDAYIEDEDDMVYDIEMQTTYQSFLPKRTRYYQGIIDLNLIERGGKYKDLKTTYIIFICMKDPFKEGLHVYTFKNKCVELPWKELGDGTTKIFLNAEGTADDIDEDLKDFFDLLNYGYGKTELSQKIKEEVEKSKSREEWRTDYMTLSLWMQDIEDEAREAGLAAGREVGLAEGREVGLAEGREVGLAAGRAEGRAEERILTIIKMVQKGLSKQEILDFDYSEEEYQKAKERFGEMTALI